MHRFVLITIIVCSAAAHVAAQKQVEFRARVNRLTPQQPAMIHWRYGGEGLGGDVISGVVTREKPKPPGVGQVGDADGLGDDLLDGPPEDRIVVPGKTYNTYYLKPGIWSDDRPLSDFGRRRGRRYITFMLTGYKTQRSLSDCELELEFRFGKKTLKRLVITGPKGPTFGVVIPLYRLDEEGRPTDAFIEELASLREHADRKLALLNSEPWINRRTPRLYGVITDCAGYGTGARYGVRTTDKATMLAEFEVIRLLGINGLRSSPPFAADMIRSGEGLGAHLRRVKIGHTIGYPIPTVSFADGKKPRRSPGDGCPTHPDNLDGMEERCRQAAQTFLESVRDSRLEAVWALTLDEIGTVFGRSPERNSHAGACPYCREGLREMIKADGRTLEDFGAPSWDDIRSTFGYWSTNYWESHRILSEAVAKAKKRMDDAAGNASAGDDFKLEASDDQIDPAEALIAARKRLDVLEWKSQIIEVPEEKRQHRLSPEGWHLLEYYSRLFKADASARLFEPLQRAFAGQNEAKHLALQRGETDTPVAMQPFVYSYALRTNAFLMGGHSLDFFDFYRRADNAFVYETSNRDHRIWHWDSYLCDVGRSVRRFQNKKFGIYVKPHRGAGAQRALAAVARGVDMIYWYTYGPEWKKGDGFGGSPQRRREVAWVSRIIAETEDVTYQANWAVPAEVAIIRPRTAEFFSGSASWENGKWLYTALKHAHIPVDALDEVLIETHDLSSYKVIVIAGSHLRLESAKKLRQWVADGGTLYTCGYGMALDESGRPLTLLDPVFGVRSRQPVETWGQVPKYGATKLRPVKQVSTPPADAAVNGLDPLAGTFVPVVGREVLQPTSDAAVVAKYADGSAAALRHRFDKGEAWLIGTYAGVEYAWETMQDKPFNEAKRSWITQPILAAGVLPVVDTGHPKIEGLLLEHPVSKKQALVLINWSFEKQTDCRIKVRGTGSRSTVRSAALDQPLNATAQDPWLQIELPSLNEGDILILD